MKKYFKFLICIVLLLIPISVNADVYYPDEFTGVLFDNNNGSLTMLSSELENNAWTGKVGFIANSSGAAWGFDLRTPLIEGHTYALTIGVSTSNQSYSDIVFSTYNRIGLGSTLNSAISSYQNSTNTEIIYTSNVNGTLQFAFKATSNGSYLVVPFCTSYSINSETVYFHNYVLEDLGSSSNVSQDTINSSLNNQTNEINNSISNSENNIKDSIKETEDNIKDGIKEGFESCRDSYNLFSYSLFNMNQTYGLIELDNSKSYVLSVKLKEGQTIPSGIYFGFTDKSFAVGTDPPQRIDILSNGKFIGSPNSNGWYVRSIEPNSIYKYVFVFPRNINLEQYFYINLNEGSVPKDYEPYGEQICKNRIDDTNDKLDNIDSTINDSSLPDTSGYGNVAGWLPPGPVDSLINLPLTLFTSLTDSLSKTCQSINLPLPYINEVLPLPCINDIYSQIDGLTTWINSIGVIVSAFILFSYLLKLYKWVDDTLSFRENNHLDNWGGV